jgi:pyruvate/2-oxoacid:ferredoxin oxidoreductase beta subunit
MTGGQVAPTTLLGQRSTTTPSGRSAANEGYPLRVSELLSTLEAPVYIERVGLGDNRQIAQAARAIRRAVENQVRGLGFSLVEILSPCPTIWKMSPIDASIGFAMLWKRPTHWACCAIARKKHNRAHAARHARRLNQFLSSSTLLTQCILSTRRLRSPRISIFTFESPGSVDKAFCCSAKSSRKQV